MKENMLKKIRMFLIKEVWILVKTITYNGRVNIDGKGIPYNFYFHLYESNKNNRKVEFGSTHPLINTQLEHIANQISIYHTKIRRWEAGRYDPDIPKYNEISEEDTVNALRGKI